MKLKNMIQKFKNIRFVRNEKGQGIIEYVLLAVVVLALVGIFRNKIRSALEERTESLGSEIKGFQGNE